MTLKRGSLTARLNTYFYKVECPKCHAPVGKQCWNPSIDRLIHRERAALALRLGFMPQMKMYGATTPKEKKPEHVHIPGEGPKHLEGTISGNCKAGRHSGCSSLRCECTCHQGKVYANCKRGKHTTCFNLKCVCECHKRGMK